MGLKLNPAVHQPANPGLPAADPICDRCLNEFPNGVIVSGAAGSGDVTCDSDGGWLGAANQPNIDHASTHTVSSLSHDRSTTHQRCISRMDARVSILIIRLSILCSSTNNVGYSNSQKADIILPSVLLMHAS